jgi:hypothetical protein
MHNSFSNTQPAARFRLESELGVQWFSSAKDAALEAAHQLRFGTPSVTLHPSGGGKAGLERYEEFTQELMKVFP